MTAFMPLNWSDMLHMAPELSLAAVFLLLVIMDLLLPKRMDRSLIGWLSLLSLLISIAVTAWQLFDLSESNSAGQAISLLGNSYRVDGFGGLLKLVFLSGTSLIILMSLGSLKKDQQLADHAEYYYLLLPAAVGAMIMASSGNLITMYIGLELLSITSYVLVGLRKRSAKSAEAAFKYVVTGGIASAFILFGMSYLYGVTGAVDLGELYSAMPAAISDYKALVYVGFFFLIGGFAIKIAAAPFHAWAPDVYQGAPTPIAAFLAVVSKGAALAVLFRIMFNVALYSVTGNGDSGVADDTFLALLALGAAAMLVGTTAALKQGNVKRLLALSGVANAGYLLVPIGISITLVHSNNFAEFWFYLVAYLLMNVGAFAVLTVVNAAAGHDELSGFSGMYYRAPWTAIAMLVFILSLAGLPLTGGFFGKLFILLGAASAKAYWLIAIMVVSSVISYYFYFRIVRQMFMRSNGDEQTMKVPITTGIVIWLCASATIALGLFPAPLMTLLDSVFSLQMDMFVQ